MTNDTITINGFDLSEVIRIIEIIRPVGNERTVTTNDAPLLGVNVQEVRTGGKFIKIKFAILEKNGMTVEKAKHTLAGIFNTAEAVKIVISDEPDKYYIGLVTGSVDVDNVTRWFQKGEFELLIPDGVAHSSTYRMFDNGTVSSDKIVFNLVNDGNVPAYPIITVKNNQENGYIGVVNTSGALEIGDREEVDTEQVKQSEMLLDYRDSKILQGYSAATKTGGLTTSNVWGRNHIMLSSGLSGHATWTIPDDSNSQKGSLNDYIWGRMICWLGNAKQKGFIRLNVRGLDGSFLYALEINKGTLGLGCEYNLWVRDNTGVGEKRKSWKFTGTHKNNENPFNQGRGWFDVLRRDDVLQVYWWGSYKQMRFPELKGLKTGQIELIIGGYQNADKITHLYLDSLYYRKDFVEKTKDVPNRYQMGSNVVLDSENDMVTVDGLERIVDIVHGSTFLSIPPGKSTLELYFSSWVKNGPSVKIEFEERYL